LFCFDVWELDVINILLCFLLGNYLGKCSLSIWLFLKLIVSVSLLLIWDYEWILQAPFQVSYWIHLYVTECSSTHFQSKEKKKTTTSQWKVNIRKHSTMLFSPSLPFIPQIFSPTFWSQGVFQRGFYSFCFFFPFPLFNFSLNIKIFWNAGFQRWLCLFSVGF
jgi:hypothetical protein